MNRFIMNYKNNKVWDDMKKAPILILAITLTIMSAASCGNSTKGENRSKDSIIFDSIKVDSTLSLDNKETSPSCHVSICLTYAKGKNADFINDSIIRSGILSPDYFSITSEKLTPKEAADSFVSRYITEYQRDYGEMYKADKKHGTSYNCEYIVKTRILDDNEKYYTYIADIYSYGGGAHGISVVVARNIDAETGKIVSLKDIFVPGYEQELNNLIVKSLCRKYNVTDLSGLRDKTIFMGIDVYAPDNFIIGSDEITFIYSSDEIACHAEGEITATIKNEDLDKLFRK